MDTSLTAVGVDGLTSWADFSRPGTSGGVSMLATLRVAWRNEQAQDPSGFPLWPARTSGEDPLTYFDPRS